ncbi:hypothetical protein SDC9_210859 [bioreactor metagenome]|uniref:Uncharacterized protein n=1 Tax=bioreactor metagenome TaxID=1076179 RepID=A0A645JHD5_9ZZZZ
MPGHIAEVVSCVCHQIAGVRELNRVFKPLVPTLAQRLRPFLHFVLMRLRSLNAVQGALSGLRGHLHHVVQTVAGIGNGFCRFSDGLVQPQLAQTVTQHTSQATNAGNDIPGRMFIYGFNLWLHHGQPLTCPVSQRFY